MDDCISQYAEFDHDDTDEIKRLITKRAKLICKLKEKRKWYIRQKNIYNKLWIFLTIFSVVTGAILSASIAGNISQYGDTYKAILTAISILSTITVTFSQAFNVRGLFELRQNGIIEIDRLIERAKKINVREKPLFDEDFYKISDEIINISQDQSRHFFLTIGNKATSTEKSTTKQ